MNHRLTRNLLVFTVATAALHAAEEPEPKSRMRDVLKARMAEDAKKAPAAPTSATTTPADKAEKSEPAPAPAKPATAKDNAAKSPPRDPATVLPKMEVRKSRITELDQKLAKQEEDIARERKNTKPSEVDLALNDVAIAKPLAIFGGDSAQFRQRVARERVELMEAEKDLIEAIARAKTKPEKEELQKQLDQIRAMRRDLDKSLR